VVQVRITVLAGTVASFAVEPGDPGPRLVFCTPRAFLFLLHSFLLLQIAFLRPFCALLFVPFLSEVRITGLVCTVGGNGGGGREKKMKTTILLCRDLQKPQGRQEYTLNVPYRVSLNNHRRRTKWTNTGSKKLNSSPLSPPFPCPLPPLLRSPWALV
jgi:hypothetical protein